MLQNYAYPDLRTRPFAHGQVKIVIYVVVIQATKHEEMYVYVTDLNSLLHLWFMSLTLKDILAEVIFFFAFNSFLSGL